MSGLSLREVTKTFPGRPPVRAVDRVDLDVDDGTLVAIVGPSGCGKTTTLRLLAGFERPDHGTIRIGGTEVASATRSLAPERRRVGIVPQQGALFPHLDVSGNIRFALPDRRSSAARARADELLELVGLSGLGRRKPHELSGGQQQRVALARALAPRPSVVLLDEPFTALDVTLRARLRTDIAQALQESAATAVMVTHDPSDALSMADRVAVMLSGRVEQFGPPTDVYFHPANEAVARTLGDVVVLPIVATSATAIITPFGEVPAHGRAGNAVEVLVRPEQIVLDGAAGWPATVLTTQFNGDHGIVTLAPPEGDHHLVVSARFRADELPEPGHRVGVRLTGTALCVK